LTLFDVALEPTGSKVCDRPIDIAKVDGVKRWTAADLTTCPKLPPVLLRACGLLRFNRPPQIPTLTGAIGVAPPAQGGERVSRGLCHPARSWNQLAELWKLHPFAARWNQRPERAARCPVRVPNCRPTPCRRNALAGSGDGQPVKRLRRLRCRSQNST